MLLLIRARCSYLAQTGHMLMQHETAGHAGLQP